MLQHVPVPSVLDTGMQTESWTLADQLVKLKRVKSKFSERSYHKTKQITTKKMSTP